MVSKAESDFLAALTTFGKSKGCPINFSAYRVARELHFQYVDTSDIDQDVIEITFAFLIVSEPDIVINLKEEVKPIRNPRQLPRDCM